MASQDNAKVIAPPPLLYAGALALGLAADFLLIRIKTGLPISLLYAVALLLFALSLALVISAFGRFRRADTPAEPWHPTKAIVTEGPYAFTRNPMYVAMTLFYLAIALAADSVFALLFLIPLLVIVHYGVVLREERYLEAKFGIEYRSYKDRVRRWI